MLCPPDHITQYNVTRKLNSSHVTHIGRGIEGAIFGNFWGCFQFCPVPIPLKQRQQRRSYRSASRGQNASKCKEWCNFCDTVQEPLSYYQSTLHAVEIGQATIRFGGTHSTRVAPAKLCRGTMAWTSLTKCCQHFYHKVCWCNWQFPQINAAPNKILFNTEQMPTEVDFVQHLHVSVWRYPKC